MACSGPGLFSKAISTAWGMVKIDPMGIGDSVWTFASVCAGAGADQKDPTSTASNRSLASLIAIPPVTAD